MKLLYRSVQFVFSRILILIKYFIWSLKTSKMHTIKVFDTDIFKFIHYGDIARVLFAYEHLVEKKQGFEYSTLKLYKSLLKENFIVLDIGANIGLFSLIGSNKLKKNGKIFAFEPVFKTFQTLQANLALNNIRNVVASQIALSNFVGKVTFSIPDDIINKGDGDAFNSMNLNTKEEFPENESDCTTLDIFLTKYQINHVDLIKIDIEGAEMLCFQGARNLLSSDKPPVIIMECAELSSRKFGSSVFEVLSYLKEFGYTFVQYEYNQWLALPNHMQDFSTHDVFNT